MGESVTAGDETGARAEVLSRVRRELAKVERGDVVSKSVEDMRCLLAELDRVTAERDAMDGRRLMLLSESKNGWAAAEKFRSDLAAAIASRNAWAEKAAELERLVRGSEGMHVAVQCRSCGNAGMSKLKIGPMLEGTIELLAHGDEAVSIEEQDAKAAREGIADLEAQVHGNHDAIERGIRAHMILETRCAAMREALVHRGCEEGGAGCQVETPFNLCPTCEALASDAGKALLARLEKAESAVGSEAWNALKMRAQALEEAAKVVEEGVPRWGNTRLLDIAAAIRALKEKP